MMPGSVVPCRAQLRRPIRAWRICVQQCMWDEGKCYPQQWLICNPHVASSFKAVTFFASAIFVFKIAVQIMLAKWRHAFIVDDTSSGGLSAYDNLGVSSEAYNAPINAIQMRNRVFRKPSFSRSLGCACAQSLSLCEVVAVKRIQ